MSETGLVQILEGALLAAGKTLSVAQMADLFEEHERPETTQIREALKEVAENCEGRGFELVEVSSGFRFQTRQALAPWVARLWQERPQKYSRALLETLALVAYRQPITRGEIEEIRGVAVSSNIIKTLHEREWVRVVGHRDVPGRPAMYATTRQFLDYFNLKSLEQLPALAEIRDLETLNAELGFTEPVAEGEASAEGEAADTNTDTTAAQGEAGEQVEPDNPESESSAQLTLVGGTDHNPEEAASADEEPSADDEPSVEEEEPSVEEEEPSANAEPPQDDIATTVTLSEAADELEARAAETESTGVDEEPEADNQPLAEGAAEPVDAAEHDDNYTDANRPESQG